MSLLVLAAVMALADGAATAPDPTPEQVKSAEQKADADRVVCRKETVVGSHRPMKKCLTKAQWQEWDDLNKDKLNNQTLAKPGDAENFGPSTPDGVAPR